MSRSGYSDDFDESFPNACWLYGRNLERAAEGKRGQKFFRDLASALDAMPVKRLIADDLVREGEFCAIGALGAARGVDMSGLNPERPDEVGKKFGIAECLAREVVFQNDERGNVFWSDEETPEQRWSRMREWVATQIKPEPRP